MSKFQLRPRPRISYCEYEEPNLDEYVFCEKCGDYVYEYCSMHGPLLVVPDDKVPAKTNYPSFVPRAALTIPKVFLHLAPSIIPGAGLGVFTTLTLPRGVRFGPYCGKRTDNIDSMYCWQLHDGNNKWSHVVDAADPNSSNWMRYVNCARHWCEQNLVAYQYQGQIYYRTIKIIPRYTELMVFYGGEFARLLNVNMKLYNRPSSYAQNFGAALPKKHKSDSETEKEVLKTQAPLEKTDKCEKNKAQKKDNRKIPDFKKRSKKFNAPIKKIMQNKDTTTSNINSVIKKSKIEANNNEQVTAPNNIFICDVCKKEYLCKSLLENHIKKWHVIEFNRNPNTINLDCNTNYQNCKNNNLLKGKDVHYNNNHLRENKLSKNKKKAKENICSVEKPYKCSYCTKCFTQSINLDTHVRTHTGEKPYKCSYCTKCFSRSGELAVHVRTHTREKPYKCSYCTKCFTTSGDLDTHVRTHTGEKPYKCSYCTKCFSRSGELAVHVRTHTREKPYKCSYCTKCFTTSGDLDKHVRIHTGEKPYKCSYCTKCFTISSNLATHVRTHTGVKPYKCSYCTKCFTISSNLATHVRTHTGVKPYKCSYCSKCLTTSSELAVHVRTHTGEKPYKCSYCTKCFSRSDSLVVHIRTHTGVTPYKCSYCTKCFTQSSNLDTHVRTHTGVKPYKCSYCTKCFTQSGELAVHVRTHTGEKPYKCSYCTKCFTQSGELAVHVRTHTGEKPYKCSYCTKCFTQSGELAVHVRTHTGEKPYKCSYCTKCFTNSSSLAKHVRTHTREKVKIP